MSVHCRRKRTKGQRRVYKEARTSWSRQPAATPATWRDYSAWTRLDGWRFYQRYNVAPYEHRRFAQAVRRRYRRVGNTTMLGNVPSGRTSSGSAWGPSGFSLCQRWRGWQESASD